MDINIIEQKMLSLEGGRFQKLCIALFTKKYRDFIVQPNGGSLGNDKPTPGHPDFLLKKKDSPVFILVECTTQIENLDKKIKHDVDACVDEKKTGIKNEMIQEIIYCYLGRKINDNVYSKITNDLKKLNIDFNAYGIEALAFEIYNNYQCIAADFLGVKIPFFKCTFEIDEFIIESEKNQLSPSLNKQFEFRDSEIKSIEEAFKQNQFIILSGNAGVGKTMLALGYAKIKMSIEGKWIIIKANGNPNIEAIRESTCKYNNFIIDDLSLFESNIFDIIQIVRGKNVIITSRKYLTNNIENVLKKLDILYSILEVGILTDDNIKTIVKNNLKINNNDYLKKITEVAKGNPRIAFMAAEGSIKDGFLTLFNNKNIFANYYYDRINSIESWKNRSDKLLEIIGVICVLKKVSIENLKDDDQIFLLLDITKNKFKDAIEFLNKNDIVTLFYDDVVTVSDQCLTDYLSYYVFLEKKLLKLSKIIDFFFVSVPDKIVELINMFGSMFNSNENKEYIVHEVQKSWETLKCKGNIRYLKIFCAKFSIMNVDNSLTFLLKHVEDKEDTILGVMNGNVDWRLSTISSLMNIQTRTCCQIIEKMICSNSIDCQSVTDMFVQNYGIRIESAHFKYRTQISILSFFLEQKGKYSLNFLKKYCLVMLKFVISYVENRKNNYNLLTFLLKTDDVNLILLRNHCFDVIFECDDVYDSLDTYFSYYPQEESIGIFNSDLAMIETKLTEKSNRNKIRELIIYLEAKKILDIYNLHWQFMEDYLKEFLELILPIINECENMHGNTFEERENKMKEYFLEEIKSSSFEYNFTRLELFNKILECTSLVNVKIITFVKVWFSLFKNKEVSENIDAFLNVAAIVDKLNDYSYFIVDRMINEVGIVNTYSKIIDNKNKKFKEKVIAYFFKKGFELDKDTSIVIFDSYLKNIEVALPKNFDINLFLNDKIPLDKVHLFLKKYFSVSEYALHGDYQSIFFLLKKENKAFFDYMLSLDITFLEKLYILSLKNDKSYFDYEGHCLKIIVDKDKHFAVDVIEVFYNESTPLEYVRRVNSIWKCKDYISIGNLMFAFMRSKMNEIFFYNGTIMFGFYSAEMKKELSVEQLSWLFSYLNSNKDEISVKYLNALVRELGYETRKEYAKYLIGICVSEELFADFLQQTLFTNTIINSEISFFENLLKIIPDDIFFIGHRQLINDKIKKLKDQITPVLKYKKIYNLQ